MRPRGDPRLLFVNAGMNQVLSPLPSSGSPALRVSGERGPPWGVPYHGDLRRYFGLPAPPSSRTPLVVQ